MAPTLWSISVMVTILLAVPSVFCGEPFDPCAGVVCQNLGICDSGACECTPGYTGDNCEDVLPEKPGVCPDPNSFTAEECVDAFNCFNDYECSGDQKCCQSCKNFQCATPDPCAGVVCQNGGTCVSGACECKPGFTGDNCEVVLPDKPGLCPDPNSITFEQCINGMFCLNDHYCSGDQKCCTGCKDPTCFTPQLECNGQCVEGHRCINVFMPCTEGEDGCSNGYISTAKCLPKMCEDCCKRGVCDFWGKRVHCDTGDETHTPCASRSGRGRKSLDAN